MLKLTKSLPVIKERNCSASLVLDTRTNRKNASEFVYALFSQKEKSATRISSKLLIFHCGPSRA